MPHDAQKEPTAGTGIPRSRPRERRARHARENALPRCDCWASVLSVVPQARLSSRQRRFPVDQGYLVVRSQLGPAVLAQVRGRLEGLVRQTAAAWADDPSQDSTEACVVAELDAADSGFAPCRQLRLLAGAATPVPGDPWQARSLDLRAPIPGAGKQGLHPTRRAPDRGAMADPLGDAVRDAVHPRSGPLRVIPGSHRRRTPPIDTEHAYATGHPT